jgi:hypothetical protein
VQAEPFKPVGKVVVGLHTVADKVGISTLTTELTPPPKVQHDAEAHADAFPTRPKRPTPFGGHESTVNVRDVFWMTTVMAAACGLGALPFFFIDRLSKVWAAMANAIACGVMIAASFDLLHEAEGFGAAPLILGLVVGCLFIKHMQARTPAFLHHGHPRKYTSTQGLHCRTGWRSTRTSSSRTCGGQMRTRSCCLWASWPRMQLERARAWV